MVSLRKLVPLAVVAIAATTMQASGAQAASGSTTRLAATHAAESHLATSAPSKHRLCVPVHATGVGQDLGGGQTTATIYSGGVELGTTTGSFTITGVSGMTASFVGPIVFTSSVGTLTAQVTGTLDLATGAFSSTSSSVTGTGLLDCVTGRLTFTGIEDLTTGHFAERIRGRLCAQLGHYSR